jgi:ribose 5-phosphate isomerase B
MQTRLTPSPKPPRPPVRTPTTSPLTATPPPAMTMITTSKADTFGQNGADGARVSAGLERTMGKGLTEKLTDPKRATGLDKTVGELLALTPEELAYARQHPVIISADHNGAALAASLATYLSTLGIPVTDVAAPLALAAGGEKFSYAKAALPALVGLTNGSASRVVLICGNGIGMRDVARQWPGARVSYGEILHEVRAGRKAEDTNVLALGARLIGNDLDLAKLFVKTFVATPHQGMPGRYQAETDEITRLAALAAHKGKSLSLDDVKDALLPGTPTTTTAQTVKDVALRRATPVRRAQRTAP